MALFVLSVLSLFVFRRSGWDSHVTLRKLRARIGGRGEAVVAVARREERVALSPSHGNCSDSVARTEFLCVRRSLFLSSISDLRRSASTDARTASKGVWRRTGRRGREIAF